MTYVYSAKFCIATWGTLDLLNEAEPENGIRVVPAHEAWRQIEGCDGEMVHIRATSFPGRVILTVSQATALNRDLLLRLAADAVSGLVVAPMHILDQNTGEGVSIPLARLVAMPEISHQRAAAARTWTWICPKIVPLALPGIQTGVPKQNQIQALF